MTDNFGNDPHNEHGDGLHDEQGHEHGHEDLGAEHEVWHDEHPPVDDFNDQPSEEIATVSEETEMPDEHEEPAITGRKTSVLLPVAAGIGGLLFLGALLYWQFGGMFAPQGSAPIPPLRAQTAPAPDVSNGSSMAPPKVVTPVTPVADVAPTTSLSPISDSATPPPSSPTIVGLQGGTATPNAGPLPITAPVITPVSAPAPVKTPVVTPVSTPVVTPVSTPVVTPVSTAVMTPVSTPVSTPVTPVAPKVASMVVNKTPSASAPVTPVAMATPVVTPVATPAVVKDTTHDNAIDARLSALTSSVEGLQKSLASTTQQLSQVSNMIAANPPNSGIEDRLNKIEQQLSQRQAAAPVTTSASSESPTMLSDAVVTTPAVHHHEHKAKKKPSVVVIAQPDTDNAAPAPVTHRNARHHEKASVTSAKAPHWILRAATPNEAWVSTDPFSSDLKHVQIGDNLPGIGQITAIRQKGDSWVVVGSKGTLH